MCMFVFHLGVSLQLIDPSQIEVFFYWNSVMRCLLLLLLLLLLLPQLQLLLWTPITTTTTVHNHNYSYCNLITVCRTCTAYVFCKLRGFLPKKWMGRAKCSLWLSFSPHLTSHDFFFSMLRILCIYLQWLPPARKCQMAKSWNDFIYAWLE
jgi:hypothetical protein